MYVCPRTTRHWICVRYFLRDAPPPRGSSCEHSARQSFRYSSAYMKLPATFTNVPICALRLAFSGPMNWKTYAWAGALNIARKMIRLPSTDRYAWGVDCYHVNCSYTYYAHLLPWSVDSRCRWSADLAIWRPCCWFRNGLGNSQQTRPQENLSFDCDLRGWRQLYR